ncbi:MAG TPA: aminotransferase class V-fold PLP-dependent enzyme, partial [Terriglobales bacterium]|nr:aminotransferase class V-fold PLP-dependent enzyme [Terriglobales bacterium]
TGVLQPVNEIGKIAAEADVYFHTDAVQAAGKVPIEVSRIACDLLSISGHKMHAPQGIGALFVRKGTSLQPMLYGGSHERSRRAGTENVPGIIGLGKAAELAKEGLARGELGRLSEMRDRIERKILAEVEAVGVNGGDTPRVPNTTNIYFDGIEGEALVIALDLKGLGIDRRRVFFRCDGTFSRPDCHGIACRAGTGQYAVQPGETEHARGSGFGGPSRSSDGRALTGTQSGLQHLGPKVAFPT